MIDHEKIMISQQDFGLSSTWNGSIYALEKALSFVIANDNIAVSSKVVIKNYLEQEIKNFKDLQGRTEIGKTLNRIEKKMELK